jgi:hypothetical protein
MAFEFEHFEGVNSGAADAPKLWTYESTTDAVATIAASGYFNEVSGSMNLGDLIYIVGTDGVQQRSVGSEINVEPVITNGYIFTGQIQTADIDNNAVTADKLAASVAGAGLTGGAGTALAVQVDGVGVEINVDTLRLKDLGVTQAKLALNIPRTASVLISSAEWIAMAVTPKVLVAAPGANKMHRVLNVRYEVDYSSVQYTLGGNVAVQYDSTTLGAGTLASATVANTVFNGYSADSTVGAAGALASSASTTTVNKGLYLSTPTAFASGNSPIHVHVTYETVATTV